MESLQIRKIDSIFDIENAYPAFLELGPHLTDKKVFVQMVLQQISEGYCIHAICLDKETIACIGFRFFHMLAWGKILYIDDLITKRDFHGMATGINFLSTSFRSQRRKTVTRCTSIQVIYVMQHTLFIFEMPLN